MWPTAYPGRRRAGDPGSVPAGAAMTALRSVVAYLASMLRCAEMVYIIVQAGIWHSFYTAAPWRLAAPALTVAWSAVVVAWLRQRRPSAALACVDSALYLALALAAQACVPPAVRDDTFSWLVISMSGQVMFPAWYATSAVSVLIALVSPAAYLAGAALQPAADLRTAVAAAALLLVVGLAHVHLRRVLYGRALAADAGLAEADQAARKRYALLRATIERREHERLVHDTVLNMLTALARAGGQPAAGAADRCQQDVALIEAALASPDDQAGDSRRLQGDLLAEVRAVADGMRARGLTVHFDAGAGAGAGAGADAGDGGAGLPAVPAPVVAAISAAAREALANVAEHARTGEAWVTVRRTGGVVMVTVRDAGKGFDPAGVGHARLGLRRSITERTAECGGRATVRSAPGRGTEVLLCWPAPERPGQLARADHAPVPADSPW
ncbi:MAG TPA: ATP-binding protein [Trebonia sp.]|jgi:signal transduction histidine kinase